MNHLKLYAIIGFVLLALVTKSQTNVLKHQVTITSSHFTLLGTTNLNTFKCGLAQQYPTTAMPVTSTNGEYEISFDGLELVYAIADFNCELQAMNQDLQNTLKADQYPELSLQINDIYIKRQPQEIENLEVTADVTITLAGIAKNLTISEGTVINRSEESLTLAGEIDISMESFNLTPPSKFFGMVKVNSELSVSFELNMEVKTEN